MNTDLSLPQIAYYYPNPMWRNGSWVKNLLLFFDGVGILVPNYMRDQMSERDPAIYVGLERAGLLHVLEPERIVDQQATEQLSEALGALLASGVLDHLAHDDSKFAALSRSRLGYSGNFELARDLEQRLRSRGLARVSHDGLSIPMHPVVRSVVLTLLAQILRPLVRETGLDLCPVTDTPELLTSFAELLSVPASPSAAAVVTFDMETVGVDLGPVPMDEVLDFRREHQDAYRHYARSVRLFVHEIGMMPTAERAAAFENRQQQLRELARDLHSHSRSAWRQPTSFALSLAGAAWTLGTGDFIGAALAATGALAGFSAGTAPNVGAFSYLFESRAHF